MAITEGAGESCLYSRSMKTIGVIGGMSWKSSLEWYRLANELVHDELGCYHSARVLLDSLDFAEVEAFQAKGDWRGAGELLAKHAQGLEAAGADLVVICANTMHIVADEVQSAITIPLLHIADAVSDAILAEGISTVGLLGTAFTMERPFYRERLAENGVTALIPNEEDRRLVHSVIYGELVHGVLNPESRQRYREVINRLVEDGAQGIILGCTEIELLVSAEDSPVPVFPTTAIHVRAAIQAAKEN